MICLRLRGSSHCRRTAVVAAACSRGNPYPVRIVSASRPCSRVASTVAGMGKACYGGLGSRIPTVTGTDDQLRSGPALRVVAPLTRSRKRSMTLRASHPPLDPDAERQQQPADCGLALNVRAVITCVRNNLRRPSPAGPGRLGVGSCPSRGRPIAHSEYPLRRLTRRISIISGRGSLSPTAGKLRQPSKPSHKRDVQSVASAGRRYIC